MNKKKILELQLRICLLAMVLAIILGVLMSPLQFSKPNAVIKINQDREFIINTARTELMMSKTKKEMGFRANGKPLEKLTNPEEEALKKKYQERVSRQRGINLLEEYPTKGTAGNSTMIEVKLKEKNKVKSKTRSLSESFKKGLSASKEETSADENE